MIHIIVCIYCTTVVPHDGFVEAIQRCQRALLRLDGRLELAHDIRVVARLVALGGLPAARGGGVGVGASSHISLLLPHPDLAQLVLQVVVLCLQGLDLGGQVQEHVLDRARLGALHATHGALVARRLVMHSRGGEDADIAAFRPGVVPPLAAGAAAACRLQRNGVDTSGAAAKVMNFDGLGKKVRSGTSGKIKAPKKSLCQKT